MGMDLGSVYSSLEFRLNNFEANINSAIQGFYKLQLGTANASKLMDSSVSTAMGNIEKSFKLMELNSGNSGRAMMNNAKYVEMLKQQLNLLDAEVKKTDATLNKLVSEFGKGSREVEAYKSHVLDLKLHQAELNKEIEKCGTLSGKFQALNSSIEATEQKFSGFTQVGQRVSGLGQTLTMGVTTPILGIGAAAVKVGMDFDSQMSRVQAISGATGGEFKSLNDQALQLGADTAFSSKQAAEGMENLASAGFTTKEIMSAMPGMLDLAASSGENLANSADIAASTLRGFGLEASQAGHVADVLAKNAGSTNAAVADTGEAMKYIAPVAHAMGLSLEEVTAAIGEMANAGIKGSQAGTTLRSSLTMLASPSKESAKLMESIGFNAFDAQGKLLPLNQIVANLQNSTANLTDKQKENAIATIFGTEAMSGMLTLVQAGPQSLNDLTASLKSSDGAANEMAKTMQNNAKSSVEQMMGSLETAGIKIEQAVAPSIKSIADTVGNLADRFSQLNPETQSTIIKFGLLAATVGPCVLALGKMIESIVAIQKGFAIVKGLFFVEKIAETGAAATVAAKGVGALSTVLNLGKFAFNPWVLGAVAAGFGIYKLVQYLNGGNSSMKSFGDQSKKTANDMSLLNAKVGGAGGEIGNGMKKISDSTKQAIDAYMNLDKKASTSLLSLKANNTVVTKQIASDMKKNIDDMGKQIVDGVKKRGTEGNKELQTMFQKSKGITDNEKANIIQSMQNGYNQQAKDAQTAADKINLIYETAANNHRQLTSEEVSQIQGLQQDMQKNAITVLSQSQEEQKAIFEEIKNNATQLSTEEASSVIQQSAKQRDESIQAATDQCTKTIAEITYQRDTAHTISAEQADKLIAEAKRQKEEAITQAQEQHQEVVTEVQNQCKDAATAVDEGTGAIKTPWQRLCDWFTTNIIHMNVDSSQIDYALAKVGQLPSGTPIGSHGMGGSAYAGGTDNARRGFNLVGEEGPEIVWFDGGEKVSTASETKGILSGFNSNSGYDSARTWGSDLSQGLADGMNGNRGLVSKAVSAISDSIYKMLHFSVPDEGPLASYEEWMPDFVQGLAKGLDDNSYYLNNSAVKLGTILADSVMPERQTRATYFEYMEKGTMTVDKAMADLDGKIKLLQVSTGDYTTDSRNLLEVMTNLSTEINIMTQNYNAMIASHGSSSKEAIDALEKLNDLKIKYQETGQSLIDMANKVKEEQIQNIDDVLSKVKEALKEQYSEEQSYEENRLNLELETKKKSLQSQIDSLDAQLNKHDIEVQDAEDTEKESQLRQMLQMNYSKKKKEELQQELDDLLKEREERKYKESIEAQKTALQNQITTAEDNNAKQLQNIQDFYEAKLRDANLNAEAEQLIMNNNQDAMIKLLHDHGKDYELAGQDLGTRLVNGFKTPLDSLKSMFNDLYKSITQVQSSIQTPSLATSAATSSSYINNTNTTTVSNSYGALFNAEKVVLSTSNDIKNLATELQYYIAQVNKSKGVS